MSSQVPFFAPGAGPPQPQTPAYQGGGEDPRMACDNCGQYIDLNEECVEILHGIAGMSSKTGRSMVVESPGVTSQPFARLHLTCIAEYVSHCICDWDTEPELCAVCEAKLEVDD